MAGPHSISTSRLHSFSGKLIHQIAWWDYVQPEQTDALMSLMLMPRLKKREGVPEMGTKPLKALRARYEALNSPNRGSKGL